MICDTFVAADSDPLLAYFGLTRAYYLSSFALFPNPLSFQGVALTCVGGSCLGEGFPSLVRARSVRAPSTDWGFFESPCCRTIFQHVDDILTCSVPATQASAASQRFATICPSIAKVLWKYVKVYILQTSSKHCFANLWRNLEVSKIRYFSPCRYFDRLSFGNTGNARW